MYAGLSSLLGNACSSYRQHCSQTLLDFNGGASCVQVYVNQHDFFINRVRADPNIDSQLYVCDELFYILPSY